MIALRCLIRSPPPAAPLGTLRFTRPTAAPGVRELSRLHSVAGNAGAALYRIRRTPRALTVPPVPVPVPVLTALHGTSAMRGVTGMNAPNLIGSKQYLTAATVQRRLYSGDAMPPPPPDRFSPDRPRGRARERPSKPLTPLTEEEENEAREREIQALTQKLMIPEKQVLPGAFGRLLGYMEIVSTY